MTSASAKMWCTIFEIFLVIAIVGAVIALFGRIIKVSAKSASQFAGGGLSGGGCGCETRHLIGH